MGHVFAVFIIIRGERGHGRCGVRDRYECGKNMHQPRSSRFGSPLLGKKLNNKSS